MYGWGNYGGLGVLDYYGLLAQANLQDCDPMDSACVSNNVAKQAAVQDLWVSKYMTTGAPDDVKLTFAPQTQAEVREFYNPSDLFWSGNVVDTRGIMTSATGGKTTPYVPPPSPPPPPPPPNQRGTNPAGKAIINSSGAQNDPTQKQVFDLGGSFISSVPWWGWLAGAGVAVFALKGAR